MRKVIERIKGRPSTLIDGMHVGYLSTAIVFHEFHVLAAGILAVCIGVEVVVHLIED